MIVKGTRHELRTEEERLASKFIQAAATRVAACEREVVKIQYGSAVLVGVEVYAIEGDLRRTWMHGVHHVWARDMKGTELRCNARSVGLPATETG